ncbi:MAG: hypothetical protein IPG22_06305 [Acidobacteria bacterium]|nr:hypothetical protein [Acidobacteriota bacterium]
MNSDLFKAYRDQLAKEELENESLRQRLSAALDDLEVAKNVANGNVEAKFDAWKQLDAMEHELAAALAAIKVKDEALSKIEYLEADNGCILSAGECSSIATEALAIQPDDSALKAWLEMSNTADCRPQSSLQGVVK